MSLTGSRFSSDSAPRALPSWDSKTRWNNLSGDLAVNVTAGSSGHTNSPHPSSREGHHSTWVELDFLLLHWILHSSQATATSLVHRNSVPSTQMRCMITASRRARANQSSDRRPPAQNAPRKGREQQQSHEPGDRPEPPHQDGMNRKTVPGRDPIIDRLHSESHRGDRITVHKKRQRLSQQNLP